MKKMWIGIALGALLTYLVGSTLYVAGSFKTIHPHSEITLSETYTTMPGPEDMDLDRDAGLLFISSTDRWKIFRGEKSDDGIYVLDIRSESQPRKLATTYTGEFHPHGISFLKSDSSSYLFVVNHQNAQESEILIFEYRADTLIHKRTLASEDLCCPNDIAAVDADNQHVRFYVTNDHGTRRGFMRTLEDYGRIPLSDLMYYDGNTFSKVYGGVNYANGVNISNDGKYVYLATTTGRDLYTFSRQAETGNLELISKTALKTGLDNIDVDEEGNLWIAAHPKLLAFVAHAKDPAKPSPSQVLKLMTGTPGEFTITEIYMDDGKQLSGSSIAVRFGKELFIGGVFESKVLRSELK